MAIFLRQLKLPKPASSERLFAHVHMQKHEHIDRQTDSMNLQEGLRKTKATLALLEREAVGRSPWVARIIYHNYKRIHSKAMLY